MRKGLFIWLIVLAFSMQASAQVTDKLSATTKAFLLDYEQQKRVKNAKKAPAQVQDEQRRALRDPALAKAKPLLAAPEKIGGVDYVSAFISLDNGSVGQLYTLGVKVEEEFDGFVTALIPVDKIQKVAALEGVTDISVATAEVEATDRATHESGAFTAMNHMYGITVGLPQAYDGTGVIVGVIDKGIDFTHQAFRDYDGNSRIVKAWAYDKAENKVKEYEPSDIGKTLFTDNDESDHGTHVSCIAGGTWWETSDRIRYGGMAPKADLVLCGVHTFYTTRIANAIKNICNYADKVGKPCVINMSFGSQYAAHDGTCYISQVMNQMAGPGHILVEAAGNEADEYANGGMYVAGRMGKGCPPFETVLNQRYYLHYDDTYGYHEVSAAAWSRVPEMPFVTKILVIDKEDKKIVWASQEFTAENSGTITAETVGDDGETKFGDFYKIGSKGKFTIAVGKNIYNKKYNAYIELDDVVSQSSSGLFSDVRTSDYAIAFSFYPTDLNAESYIDIWAEEGYFSSLGDIHGHQFHAGNTMCSSGSYTGTDSLIMVGAYVTKDVVTHHTGTVYQQPADYRIGDILSYSSYKAANFGPTDDVVPHITAPGATIVSAVNHFNSRYTNDNNACSTSVRVNNDVLNPYGNMSGTSMATPCVAGIIAMWLQANPKLSVAEVMDILKTTAIHDEFTDKKLEFERARFGNGKISAVRGLKAILARTGQTGGYDPAAEKCATPTISYRNGVFEFSCATEGVEFLPTVTCSTEPLQDGNKLTVGTNIVVTVYALKDGYIESEPAAMSVRLGQIGDVNGDGQITIADVTSLVNNILQKGE